MASAPPSTDTASPGYVMELLSAYQRSTALYAAIDLDVFRAVGEGAGTAGEIARRCSASERGIRILCDFLTILGILRKENGEYKHTPTSATFLDPQSPACLASTARFIAAPKWYEPYLKLSEIVRNGHTTLPGEGSVEPENPLWVEFARSMAPLMRPVAGPLAETALAGRSGPIHVLDIAAGHGLFGIEVARRNIEAKVTALDWGMVLEVAKENAAKAGVADRYRWIAGDAFETPFDGPYDVVLLTNFLHHFDPETCTKLLTKIHGSCSPGAVVATLDFVPNEDRVTPPASASFSLTMLASTKSGDAYTFRELEGMYREAGFLRMQAHPIADSPQTVVVGFRD